MSTEIDESNLLTTFIATIPGRPPLHERSISAPGSWRRNVFGDAMISCITGPSFDDVPGANKITATPLSNTSSSPSKERPSEVKQALSPKNLAPLVIPSNDHVQQPRMVITKSPSITRLMQSEERPPEVPPKSPRTEGRASPKPKTPYTPESAPTSTLLVTPEGRASPKPWNTQVGGQSPQTHQRGQPDNVIRSHSPKGHQRGQSDASIMERGRPTKRTEPVKRSTSKLKRSQSSVKRAYETLPLGMIAAEANEKLSQHDITKLQKQAIGQVEKFEVLNVKDVECLSKVSCNELCLSLTENLPIRLRNSVALMIAVFIFETHTIHYELAVAACIHVWSNT